MENQVTNDLFSALLLTCMITEISILCSCFPPCISPCPRYRPCQGRDYLSAEIFYMMPTTVVKLKLVTLSYYKILYKMETVSENN